MPTLPISRREFLSTPLLLHPHCPSSPERARSVFGATPAARFTPPNSPRARINFNLNWRFIREDVRRGGSSRLRRLAMDNHQHAAQLQRRRLVSGRSSLTAAATLEPTRGSRGIASTSSFPPASQAAKSFSNSKACARPATFSSMGKRSGCMRTESPPTASTSAMRCNSDLRRTCWRSR